MVIGQTSNLFAGDRVYILDTSSINTFLLKFAPGYEYSKQMISTLDKLIECGVVIIPQEVFDEEMWRKTQAHAVVWIKKHEKMTAPNVEYLNQVKKILSDVPQLHNHKKKPRYDADPFLLAVAVKHGGIVVTSESREKIPNFKNLQPGSINIPQACEKIGIPVISTEEFVDEVYRLSKII